MARIKLDEDLSLLVGEPLRDLGHEVLTIVGQRWGGWPDQAIWERLKEEKVLFITADKGFGDLRAYPPGTHEGIVLLRPQRESVLMYQDLVRKLLAHHDPAELRGMLVVVSDRDIRIRRA